MSRRSGYKIKAIVCYDLPLCVRALRLLHRPRDLGTDRTLRPALCSVKPALSEHRTMGSSMLPRQVHDAENAGLTLRAVFYCEAG